MSSRSIYRTLRPVLSSSVLSSGLGNGHGIKGHVISHLPTIRFLSSDTSSSATENSQPENHVRTADGKVISTYWGIPPTKITKPDGSAWKWNCFQPWDSYKPDVSIDVTKHHKPSNFTDKFAYWTVQTLKIPVQLFFQVILSELSTFISIFFIDC